MVILQWKTDRKSHTSFDWYQSR